LSLKEGGVAFDRTAFEERASSGVGDVVRQQVQSGLDTVNDGEFGKANFSNYARERLSGIEKRNLGPGEGPPGASISGRDMKDFPDYFRRGMGSVVPGRRQIGARTGRDYLFCSGPLTYVGQSAVQADIARFKQALQGIAVEETFLTAVAPGTIEHWLRNEHYPSDEAFLFAIADAMHEEYKAIVDAGFVLQIDDPDLADGWQLHTEMSVAEYRKFAELRLDALKHALQGCPAERVRFHMCWGSYHGPHKHDIPLEDIVDLILKVPAQAYSVEASNPCHEHEWRVWENGRLPEGKLLIPGVVGHFSDFIEHPQLIAERLVRYARVIGRENLVAGTDCGLGGRVGHAQIAWAKLESMAEGARLASRQLWP
jgi:5-methyltetrahydropteroyltriglutamate--homocysteine methyltransferase